jgi:hypothetical protein
LHHGKANRYGHVQYRYLKRRVHMAKEETRKMAEDQAAHQEVIANAGKTGLDFTAGGTEATPLNDDDLEKASGGYYNGDGLLMTTIAYGCQHWEERPVWSAAKGQCGSCIYWDRFSCPTLDAFTIFGQTLPCTNPNNRKR